MPGPLRNIADNVRVRGNLAADGIQERFRDVKRTELGSAGTHRSHAPEFLQEECLLCAPLAPVINFPGENNVESINNGPLRLGCRRSPDPIRVM